MNSSDITVTAETEKDTDLIDMTVYRVHYHDINKMYVINTF